MPIIGTHNKGFKKKAMSSDPLLCNTEKSFDIKKITAKTKTNKLDVNVEIKTHRDYKNCATAIMIHGLLGDCDEILMKTFERKLYARGCNVAKIRTPLSIKQSGDVSELTYQNHYESLSVGVDVIGNETNLTEKKCFGVGHSLGGTTLINYISEHKTNPFNGIILISPYADKDLATRRAAIKFGERTPEYKDFMHQSNLNGIQIIPEIANQMAMEYGKKTPTFSEFLKRTKIIKMEIGGIKYERSCPSAIFGEVSNLNPEFFDPTKIDLPVFTLMGANDTEVPVKSIEKFVKNLPNKMKVKIILPGEGHLYQGIENQSSFWRLFNIHAKNFLLSHEI